MTIKQNAPEGATHYAELKYIDSIEYFRVYSNTSIYVYDDMWHKLAAEQHSYILKVIKPL